MVFILIFLNISYLHILLSFTWIVWMCLPHLSLNTFVVVQSLSCIHKAGKCILICFAHLTWLLEGKKEEAPWQLPTCEHAFIHHATSINQNSIAWQWKFSWKNENISGNQETGFQLLKTYTGATFSWSVELFLFLPNSKNSQELLSTFWLRTTLHAHMLQPLSTQLQIPRKLGLGNWCLGLRKGFAQQ